MKHLIITFLLTITTAMQALATGPINMYIWMKDGSNTVLQLSEKPQLTFNDVEMTVTTKATSVSFPYNQLQNITYKDFTTDITSETIDKESFVYNAEGLLFKANSQSVKVMIVSIDGTWVRQFNIRPNESATVPSSALPKGTYVVAVNGITYKIRKL